MKRCLLRLYAIVALTSLLVPGGLQPVEPVHPAAAEVDAVGAASMNHVGAPLPACGIATGVILVEPGSWRTTRCQVLDTACVPSPVDGVANAGSGDDRNSHFCEVAARLARSGIHTSALGTPPPQA